MYDRIYIYRDSIGSISSEYLPSAMYVVSVAIADACARSVHASSPTSCDPRRIRPRGGSLGFGSGGRAAPNRDPAAVLAGRLAAVSRGAHAAEQQGGGGGARGAHAKAEHGGGGRVHIGGDAGVVHREMRIRRRLRDIREGGESRCEAGVESSDRGHHVGSVRLEAQQPALLREELGEQARQRRQRGKLEEARQLNIRAELGEG